MELKREVVEFRDGTKLTVTEANWAISMRLQELEEQARESPLEDAAQQTFNLILYPKFLACSSGAVPTLEEALEMPSTELDKWYFAVKRLNPDWFVPLEQATEEEVTKKKAKKPIGSTPNS